MQQEKAFFSDQEEEETKLLYVDVANYAMYFFPIWRSWSLEYASQAAKRFCRAFDRSGWTLKGFIDQSIMTAEAQAKWRKRREREVRLGVRTVPHGCLRLLGDLLEEHGIPIHYSVEADNDDTLASHAQQDGASVLSQDVDFLRYRGATYTLYSNFSMIRRGKVQLVKHEGKRKASWRDLMIPPPCTGPCNPFRDVVENQEYLRGTTSPLIEELGNIHVTVRPLRSALYKKLGVDQVQEEFPVQKGEEDSNKHCVWDKQMVAADETCTELLLSPEAAVAQYSQERPEGASTDDWYKHQFALRTVIAEICCTASGKSLLTTLRPLLASMDVGPIYKRTKKVQNGKKTNGKPGSSQSIPNPASSEQMANNKNQKRRISNDKQKKTKTTSHYLQWRKSQKTGESNKEKRERYLKLFPEQCAATQNK